MRKSIITIASLLALQPVLAQTDASLAAVGYAAPGPVEVAPGQIITLFFLGIKSAPNGSLRSGQAQSVPIPASIAGLSVEILQLPETTPFPLPILAVRQQNECEEVTGRPICLVTAIRVQMPSALTPTVAKLLVKEDGQASRTFLVRPIRNNAHIVTSCDLTWDTNPGSVCRRLAYHANGTMVDENAPAKPGETIVLYAHGLGPTLPGVNAGDVSPAGAAVIDATYRQLKAGFSVFRNASPSTPRYFEADNPEIENAMVYAGLTPGQVGLYQINVRIPGSLAIPIPCGGDTRSNVLVKISTPQGTENMPMCVEP
jgi:uncharacterized protein (TIGR03437 family)